MNNELKGNLNSFGKDTNNNIDIGVDTMAKKIREILEPISAKRCYNNLGGHTNEKDNIRCKNFFRQR